MRDFVNVIFKAVWLVILLAVVILTFVWQAIWWVFHQIPVWASWTRSEFKNSKKEAEPTVVATRLWLFNKIKGKKFQPAGELTAMAETHNQAA